MLSPSLEVLSYPNYATHLTNTHANIFSGGQESYSLNILPDKQAILFENNVALLEEFLDEIWQTPKIVHTGNNCVIIEFREFLIFKKAPRIKLNQITRCYFYWQYQMTLPIF